MKKRNIVLAIIFSFITCGIYALYWFVCLTNDSNELAESDKTASGGLALLFSLLTLGIYTIYWAYKLGKKLDGSGVVNLILCLFGLAIIIYPLAQSKINEKITQREQASQAAQQPQE